MNEENTKAAARSNFLQLVAMAFTHPDDVLLHQLNNVTFSQIVAQTGFDGFGQEVAYRPPGNSITELEATYIDLFQVGRGGKPKVSLNAGEYNELSGDHSRPEFLLRYSDWYRHFGLEVDDAEGANEFPDHLICQLEFMSWLAHLESQAEPGELQGGYRLAQRDFTEQQLLPFLKLFASAIESEDSHSSYGSLARQLYTCMESQQQALGENVPHSRNTADEEVAVVNLWE